MSTVQDFKPLRKKIISLQKQISQLFLRVRHLWKWPCLSVLERYPSYRESTRCIIEIQVKGKKKGKDQHLVSFLGRCLSYKGVRQETVDDNRFFWWVSTPVSRAEHQNEVTFDKRGLSILESYGRYQNVEYTYSYVLCTRFKQVKDYLIYFPEKGRVFY